MRRKVLNCQAIEVASWINLLRILIATQGILEYISRGMLSYASMDIILSLHEARTAWPLKRLQIVIPNSLSAIATGQTITVL